jgi:hypothetical protein
MKQIIIIILMAFALCVHAGKAAPAVSPDPDSAQEYFQRGNAFYKQCDYAHAMVCYMRAQKTEPLNKDIQHNINITRSKTVDKMPPESNIFFVEWYKALVMTNTIDNWAMISIVSLIVALLLFLAYLFVSNIAVRKVSFYTCVVSFLVFCFSVFFAWNRKYLLNIHDTAIVVKESVAIKNLPSTKAPETAIIHEGTCVRITDKDMKGWFGIRLSDGREGWIRAAYVELI